MAPQPPELEIFECPRSLTSAQRQKVKDFKAEGLFKLPNGQEYEVGELEQYLLSDWTATRFLVARSWNVTAARQMFQQHLQVRQKMNLSTILRRFSINEQEEAAIKSFCPAYWLGTDLKGRPIYCQSFANLDGNKLFEGISADKILEAQSYTCEILINNILPACSAHFKRPIRQTASLIDFRDVSYSQLWTARWFAKKYLAFQESQYPDYLGVSYIVNAPRALNVVWKMAARILPEATIDKIHILGADYQTELLKSISKDNLPVEYGGTRTDKFYGVPRLEAILEQAPGPGELLFTPYTPMTESPFVLR